ncbi:MAG TPA: FG-GAP-like repeat-containing protein [Pelobium sp.]
MKKNFYFIIITICVLASSCAKEQLPGVSPYSSEKQLLEFNFLKADNPSLDRDYKSSVEGQSIAIEVPKGIDLKALIPTFVLSDKAALMIDDKKIESGKTAVDFSKQVSFTVLAQNRSLTKYYPTVLLVGVTQDFQANAKTSYNNYIKNNLYEDFSKVIQKTALNVAYFEDAYNARAYADFDKDGDLDVIAGASNAYGFNAVDLEYFSNDVFTYKKDQSAFANGTPKMLNPRKAIVADLDNNGWPDVVFVGSGFDRSPYAGESIKLLLNFNGKFTTKEVNVAKGYYAAVSAGDIDNDGDVDLFVTDNKSVGRFLINDGAGNFKEDTTIFPGELWGKAYNAAELLDINNDGYLDLVVGGNEYNGTKTMLFLGNASGTFMTTKMVLIPSISGFGLVVDIDFIDYDKDGKTDILINRTGDGKLEQPYYTGYYLQLLKSKGTNFEDVSRTAFPENASQSSKWINLVRVQDVDNDGDLDITSDDKYYGLAWLNNNGVFSKK